MAHYRYGCFGYYGRWAPYVPVAERRRKAQTEMTRLRKKGVNVEPVVIQGRKIAETFWGEAWCNHIESFSDFQNRLPRGRTYVRNGSVCHLSIKRGKIEAKVSGSHVYDVTISIAALPAARWRRIKKCCCGRIGSLLELLQGTLSDHVMEAVTDRSDGLFPQPGEMKMKCTCPDWATMCKHVAAVLYGVGARLDSKPELLFVLRGVNHEELIAGQTEAVVAATSRRGKSKRLAEGQLAEVFGIEISTDAAQSPTTTHPTNQHQPANTAQQSADALQTPQTTDSLPLGSDAPVAEHSAPTAPKRRGRKKKAPAAA